MISEERIRSAFLELAAIDSESYREKAIGKAVTARLRALGLEVITEGTKEECAILDAYELYHFIFPFCFSLECPLLFSKERLSKKYNTVKFGNDNDNLFVKNVREWRERSGKYEA